MEEDFIYAAEFGDIPTVQRILDENPHLNVDFSDILGRTPLRLAVGNEHLEVSFIYNMVSEQFFWFGLRFYVPVNNFSVMSGRFLGLNQY